MVKLQKRFGQLFLQSKIEIISASRGSKIIDRHNSWERCPGDTPPQELVMPSQWSHVTFEN